jgi:hypothetical protein
MPTTTSEPLIPAHLDREPNRRWAEHCSNALARSVPKPASWFHDGTRALTYAAESATARKPLNGAHEGEQLHPNIREMRDYFFLTRYLI